MSQFSFLRTGSFAPEKGSSHIFWKKNVAAVSGINEPVFYYMRFALLKKAIKQIRKIDSGSDAFALQADKNKTIAASLYNAARHWRNRFTSQNKTAIYTKRGTGHIWGILDHKINRFDHICDLAGTTHKGMVCQSLFFFVR